MVLKSCTLHPSHFVNLCLDGNWQNEFEEDANELLDPVGDSPSYLGTFGVNMYNPIYMYAESRIWAKIF